MAKTATRVLSVLRKELVTPNMLRIVFAGESLAEFPDNCDGGYIKLIFPDVPRSHPDRPVMRTYSIRSFDAASGVMTVDFALHGESGGIATDWALNARVGDNILIAGPGTIKMVDPAADWYLIAADMTGLPALLCNVERLPATAQGYVVVEVRSEADKVALELPENVEMHWVINAAPEVEKGALVEKVKAMPWLDGKVSVWTACEFDTMRSLRGYYRNDRAVGRDQFYLSSYWRAGRTEDQHKVDKQADSVAAA
ncbi:siderophore-interacting protein [Shimia sp. R11_0]|uniref:siderophore-interacting protein n=1 Tax=Shimia sp. R11_0 TaxID=2821096 RepID=UPI001ADAE86F|nr:siderophore-interacting protein [Shimia sp. R11_0]MBO9477192.1 siderophore-interacting protein [Shimia sp. R11_0]